MDTSVKEQLDEIVQLATFRLGDEEFAVDILKIQEINRMVEITKLPEAPDYYEGIINLRGRVIPVLNLRTKFGLESKEWDKNTRIIICDVEGHAVGMVVDEVDEVLRIHSSTIEPAPEIVTSCDSDYITGVAKLDDRLLIFLNVSRIAIEASSDVGSGAESFTPQINMKTESPAGASSIVESGVAVEGGHAMNPIEMIVAKLKDVARELNGNTSELMAAAGDVVSCAQATVKAAERMSELTAKQAQCAGQVSTTIDDTTVAFTAAWKTSGDQTRKLAELLKTIQAETESARQSVEAGIQVVYQGREMADKANRSLDQAFNMSKEAMDIVEQTTPSSDKAKDSETRVEQTLTV